VKATDGKLASEIGLPNDGKSWPMEYESQRYMKFYHDRKTQKQVFFVQPTTTFLSKKLPETWSRRISSR
jgi:hypothetical protein